jgi:hypothetical protein
MDGRGAAASVDNAARGRLHAEYVSQGWNSGGCSGVRGRMLWIYPVPRVVQPVPFLSQGPAQPRSRLPMRVPSRPPRLPTTGSLSALIDADSASCGQSLRFSGVAVGVSVMGVCYGLSGSQLRPLKVRDSASTAQLVGPPSVWGGHNRSQSAHLQLGMWAASRDLLAGGQRRLPAGGQLATRAVVGRPPTLSGRRPHRRSERLPGLRLLRYLAKS